jgi:hypothetical protein
MRDRCACTGLLPFEEHQGEDASFSQTNLDYDQSSIYDESHLDLRRVRTSITQPMFVGHPIQYAIFTRVRLSTAVDSSSVGVVWCRNIFDAFHFNALGKLSKMCLRLVGSEGSLEKSIREHITSREYIF